MGSNKSGITAKLANTRGIETPQFNDQSARPTVHPEGDKVALD